MPRKRKSPVSLSEGDRVRLEGLIAGGNAPARKMTHARVLLKAALVHRKPKRTKPPKLDGSREAHLIALACSEPPPGKGRWSLRLLAERFVSLEYAEEPISRELVRRTLKKAPSSPG